MENNSLKLVDTRNNTINSFDSFYKSEPKLYMHHDTCKINENTNVTVDEYIQYDIHYLLITLNKNGEPIIIGRYLKESKNILVSYKNHNILLYYADYNHDSNSLSKIFKVINLYDVFEDISYCVTEKQALEIFDPSINTNYLIDPDGSLVNYNVVNNQKKLKRGISRFSYYGD